MRRVDCAAGSHAIRRGIALLLAMLLGTTAATAANDGFNAAVPLEQRWWETFALDATGTELLGNPVARIQRSWQRATLLDWSHFTPEQQAEIRADKRAFELRGDFNDDGTPDRVVVGVYLDQNGQRGSFIAIFTRAGSEQHWRPVYAEVGDDSRAFSAIHANEESLRVYWNGCLRCPSTSYVSWNGATYAQIYLN
jgi:hypothetical protein